MHVIKTEDYIIDIGPEGGTKDGKVVARRNNRYTGSITGKYLKPYLLKLSKMKK